MPSLFRSGRAACSPLYFYKRLMHDSGDQIFLILMHERLREPVDNFGIH